MRRLLNPSAVTLCGLLLTVAVAGPRDILTFHRDPQRTGWSSVETELTRSNVAGPSFGLLWETPQLDSLEGQAPRLYASPLYVDQVTLSAGEHAGDTFPVVFVATNLGFVYAVNAFKTRGLAPGTILWRTNLGAPCKLQPAPLDGVPTGVLSTPVIDAARNRLYVTSCEASRGWQAHALDLTSGEPLSTWPVRLDEATLNAPGMNRNAGTPAPPRRFDFRVQRGALNLSPDGALLYVTFGETSTGWLVAVDTRAAKVASAFATVATPHRSNGGIWGAGGPAIDADGNVFAVTGTGFSGFVDQPHDWVQSVLKFAHPRRDGLALSGTYTPFNYCETAAMDIDLGSGGVTLLPDLGTAATATPRLMLIGGKQGNVYLVDRARMPGRLDRRQPCSTDSSRDASLLPPEIQPQFGKRGPLNVFGPYSEKDAAIDTARGRSVPAYFRNADGTSYVFVTGSTKKAQGSPVSVPPSLARLQIVTTPGKSAYLRVDQLAQSLVFENPGSPVITSNAAQDAIVWVLDENARRSALLTGANAPQPVLYALDALTFELLWKSGSGELHTSGKYNEPAVARGSVFVGTDRIQAFGVGGRSVGRAATSIGHEAIVSDRERITGDGGGGGATIDGEAIYVQRCAACHDNPEGRIPPRSLIAMRPHDHIVEALTHGSMRPMAEGLSTEEIEAVARYLR